tara:strand:- start:2692 stop:2868 length:177 start_codon:yes stop_codon:yes gene_type:complete
MKYTLLKEWFSQRHGKTFPAGMSVVITRQSELEELIELECIEKMVEAKKEKKKKKKKE